MNRLFLSLAYLLTFSMTAGVGCTVEQGESCQIDSDCEPGTLCSREGTCQTFDDVADGLAAVGTTPPPVDVSTEDDMGSPDTSPEDPGTADDSSECQPSHNSIFTEPASGACAAPDTKKKVLLLQIAETGHGAANLGILGNSIIEDGFANEQIPLTMWVDGSFEQGCTWTVAWMRSEDDRLENCTAVFTDTMPFKIPDLVEATIYNAVYAPDTQRVTGLLNKEELLKTIDPVIRETAAGMFSNDVDTDGDGKPDHTSVILELTFEE
jgi:hypothetical protein